MCKDNACCIWALTLLRCGVYYLEYRRAAVGQVYTGSRDESFGVPLLQLQSFCVVPAHRGRQAPHATQTLYSFIRFQNRQR